MKRTWIFFKLRMLQLKSDKTSLFFCYVFPIALLLGIGFPIHLRDSAAIELHYIDDVASDASKALLAYLDDHPLVQLERFSKSPALAREAVEKDEIQHLLRIRSPDKARQSVAAGAAPESEGPARSLDIRLASNQLDENRVSNLALGTIINNYLAPQPQVAARSEIVASDRQDSYIAVLLPGLIGLTLLIIGLNGFGGVLIEERHRGIFNNLKTIDLSPIAFLSGLFLSRILIAYTVAAVLFLIAIFAFELTFNVNFALLGLIVTLGSVAFLGIGLFIATVSPTVSAFNGIVNFVQMPFVVLGGVFFSISVFPGWVQAAAKAIPLTHMINALHKLLFEAVDLQRIDEISLEVSVLAAWCVATLLFAGWKFRW